MRDPGKIRYMWKPVFVLFSNKGAIIFYLISMMLRFPSLPGFLVSLNLLL